VGGASGGIGGGPRARPRPGPGCARHRLLAAGVAGPAADTTRHYRELLGHPPAHRRAQIGTGGGASLRHQRAGGGHFVSSSRAPGWRAVGLSLGRREKARAARARGGSMSPKAGRLRPLGRRGTWRADGIDWERVSQELDERGNAVIEHLLGPANCASLAARPTPRKHSIALTPEAGRRDGEVAKAFAAGGGLGAHPTAGMGRSNAPAFVEPSAGAAGPRSTPCRWVGGRLPVTQRVAR